MCTPQLFPAGSKPEEKPQHLPKIPTHHTTHLVGMGVGSTQGTAGLSWPYAGQPSPTRSSSLPAASLLHNNSTVPRGTEG